MKQKPSVAGGAWPDGDGGMTRLIREHDWTTTPLGAIETWPQSLKMTVDLLLACGHAMQLAWGSERIILYNEAYAPMLGNRHPGALGLRFHDAWPDVWTAIEPFVERVFAGETVNFENMPLVMTRNGYPEDTWWTFSYSPVRDESGRIVGLLNVPVDATARIRAERAEQERDEANARLQKNETRFRALVTAGAQTIYRMSPDWRIMYALDSDTLAITSGPLENWPGKYILKEDRPAVFAAIQHAIETKSLFEFEHRVRLANGGIGWVLSRAVPLLTAGGDIIEWFGAASDITERHNARERLRESEERFRQFGEASSDVLWVRNTETLDWEYLSPAFETIYGFTRARALAGSGLRNWLSFILEEDRDRAAAAIMSVCEGASVSFEYRVRRPDGEVRWLRNTDFPMRGPGGAVERIGGIGQDITEEKATVAKMEMLVAELHHRTRNLIAVVHSIASQTLASTGPGEAFRAAFDNRLKALARVQGLLSRTGDEPITMAGLIRMELDALGATTLGNRVRIEGPEIRIRPSSVQTLALALHELATNARKYGALSNDSGRLSVSWRIMETAAGHRFALEWRETGGRPPSQEVSQRRSYGRELLERALPYMLGGSTSFEHDAARLCWMIDVPLDRLVRAQDASGHPQT